MAKYYNRYYISTIFNSGDKIYLNSIDIHIIYSLAKLVIYQVHPFWRYVLIVLLSL